MSEYRIYFLDSLNHVRAAADIEAGADDEAFEAATEACRDEVVELWRLDRFLCRFDPVGPAVHMA